MFTGLVETTGVLARRERRGVGFRLDFRAALGPLALGESISVNGACLTVAAMDDTGFGTDVSVETIERTTLGALSMGDRVNLERALRVGDRLGGHLVSGHVDGVAEVASASPAGEAIRVAVRPPSDLMPFLAPKGSVTLDGVSLTVNAVTTDAIELMLIPHTLSVTTLSGLAPGRRLNVEVDLLARYVVHHLRSLGGAYEPVPSDARLLGALRRAGFIPE